MNELAQIVKTNELDPQDGQIIIDRFGSYEQVAQEWETKAKQIVVTNRDQLTEMAMAREARKKFSQMRIDLEKARKAIGEPAFRKYKAVNAVAKYLQSLIQPIEDHLKLQEDFVKNDDARIAAEKALEEEKRLEAERLAREEAERKEQEQIRLENEKLKKEAEERERVLEAEREKARKEKERVEAEKRHMEQEQQKKLEAERKERERVEAELNAKKDEEERIKKEQEMARIAAEKADDATKYKSYIQSLIAVEMPSVKNAEISEKLLKIKSFLDRELTI
jgi:hypothetical protein